MSIIKPGDTMTNPNGFVYKVLEVHGASVMEIENNLTKIRTALGYWDHQWRVWSDGAPWTHTPSRPTITNRGRDITAYGSHCPFARVYDILPGGWDVDKVAAAVARFLNEVDLDELAATEATS